MIDTTTALRTVALAVAWSASGARCAQRSVVVTVECPRNSRTFSKLHAVDHDPDTRCAAHVFGRKNFLFTGSAAAGKRLAAAYTLVQTCRALGINTRDYLLDIIGKLEAGWPAKHLADLMPHRWAQLPK